MILFATREKNVKDKNNRDVHVELLRIVAMLMIIAHHFVKHGGIENSYSTFNINSALASILILGGRLGTNIFILISGYYGMSGKFSYKKILRILLEVTFYSIILTPLSCFIAGKPITFGIILEALFPLFVGGGYWFAVTYLELYLLSPIIIRGIDTLNKKQFLFLIICFFILFCVFPTIISEFFVIGDYGYNRLTWFVFIYCVGYYLKKYGNFLYSRKGTAAAKLILCIATMSGSAIIRDYLGSIGDMPSKGFVLLRRITTMLSSYGQNHLMPFLIAVLMLIVFQNMSCKMPQIIYALSGSTLGVYLIHDHHSFNDILWKDLCKTTIMRDSSWFPFYSVFCIVCVFLLCSLVDIVRRKYEKKLFKW